jgi:hypothetical protein
MPGARVYRFPLRQTILGSSNLFPLSAGSESWGPATYENGHALVELFFDAFRIGPLFGQALGTGFDARDVRVNVISAPR